MCVHAWWCVRLYKQSDSNKHLQGSYTHVQNKHVGVRVYAVAKMRV